MLCTHIIYAFAELDNVTHSIKSRHSSDLDIEEGGRGIIKWKYSEFGQFSVMNWISDEIFNHLKFVLTYIAGQYKKVVSLKQKNLKLKVSIAIVGESAEESEKHSDVTATPKNRKKFIESVLAFIW